MTFSHFYLQHVDERAVQHGQMLHLLPITKEEAAHIAHLSAKIGMSKTTTRVAYTARLRKYVKERQTREVLQHDQPGFRAVIGGLWMQAADGPRKLALHEEIGLMQEHPYSPPAKAKRTK